MCGPVKNNSTMLGNKQKEDNMSFQSHTEPLSAKPSIFHFLRKCIFGHGEGLSAQTGLQRASQGSPLGPPAAGWTKLPAGSWQNRALLARSTKWQTRTVPRNSLWIPGTAGSSQGGGLRVAPVKSPDRGLVGGTQADS